MNQSQRLTFTAAAGEQITTDVVAESTCRQVTIVAEGEWHGL